MPIDIINPAQLPAPRGFNHGIVAHGGKILFLAGQDASDAEGAIVAPGDLLAQFEHLLELGQEVAPGDLLAQFEQVLSNLQAVVREAGGQMQSIVKLNIYVRDRDDYVSHLKELGAIHRRYFGNHYPAMALFEVSGFFQRDNLIEMEGIAYLDDV